ncbi:uncharacterized protein LOC119566222 isoform X1 [Chelonia mydas]|uniref:uncharacterized protein LOC119566222 isoform X1 n=2 Tax=Chelonia mydas TaxID=8469 RepID=UPI001CA9D6E0|nr:uncharacterized protein LOC119566222 isoform X1 [Chelonia mydas]
MEQSALPKPGTAQPEVSQCKELDRRTGASEETTSGESEAPQDELTNLDETKMEQRVKYVEDKLREMNARFEGAEKRLEVLQERFSPGLEPVLTNAMGSHKFSENLNDPCQESDVLEMYHRLRTHEWEKAKCAANGSAFPMTYEKGSTIIKTVFSKCEEELSQRLERIFELLEIPVSKKTTSFFDSQQLPPGLAREIKNHLKNLYFNYGEDYYQDKIGPSLSPDLQTFQPLVHFTAECYKIYCLLLLQNPPIKAVWPTEERIPISCIQHVDNKNVEDRMPLNFLWPVLACGRLVYKKAVIYD